MSTRIRRIACIVGCLAAIWGPCPRDAHGQANDPVSGVWVIELDTTATGSRSAVHESPFLTATVALIRGARPANVFWLNLPVSTHYGVYSGDLEPLGVQVVPENTFPTAGARLFRDDSVKIVLNPAPDHGSLILDGTISDGVIRGRWEVTAYAAGRSGSFTMRKLCGACTTTTVGKRAAADSRFLLALSNVWLTRGALPPAIEERLHRASREALEIIDTSEEERWTATLRDNAARGGEAE